MVLLMDQSENLRLSEPFGSCMNLCEGFRVVLRPVCL